MYHRHDSPRRGVVLLLIAGLLAAVDARAQQDERVSVCIGRVEYHGLEENRQRALHRKLVQQLLALNADIPAETHGLELKQRCLADPDCIKETMADLEVEGVLHVRVRRVGPLAWIDLSFYDARSGMEIFSSELTAPMRDFPQAISFDADLAQGIEALRRLRLQSSSSASTHSSAAPTRAADELEEPPSSAATSPEAEEAEGSVLPLIGWGGLGLGAILLAGGAVTGGLAIAQDQELDASCVDKRCPPQLEDELVRLSLLTAATDVLLVAGGLSAVAGIVVLVLGLDDDDAG